MKRTALLLAVAAVLVGCGENGAGPRPTQDLDSGVEGQALLGPQCPVITEESACPDLPLPLAQIRVVNRNTGYEVASVTTDQEGRFRIPLPPGNYTLEGVPPNGEGNFPFSKPVDVTVEAGRFTEVVVPFDTGIR